MAEPVQLPPLHDLIIDESLNAGVNPALGLALAHWESSGLNPNAVSPTGVKGLFQVTNATGAQYGQTPQTRTDPRVSAQAGLRYFRDLLDQNQGDVVNALRQYNGGSDPQFAQHVLSVYPRYAQFSTLQRGRPQQEQPQSDIGSRLDAIDQQLQQEWQGQRPTGQDQSPAPGAQSDLHARLDAIDNQLRQAWQQQGRLPTQSQAQPASQGPPASSVQLTPGMTGEQLARAYGYDPAQFTPEQLQRLVIVAEDTTPLPFGVAPASFAGRAMHALWSNVAGAGQLLGRGLLAAGLTSSSTVAHNELMAKIDATKYAQQAHLHEHQLPLIGDPAELVGNAAFGVMIPGITRVPTAVAGGALAAMQPITDTATTPGAPGDPFAQQKATQTTLGAVAAPAVEYGVVRPLMWGVNKAVNATRGIFTRADDAALLDLAAAHGVEPTYADVREAMNAPRTARIETWLERVPGAGAAQVRQAQQGQAKTAAEAFQQHYVDAMGQASYDALPAVQQFAQQGDEAARRALNLAQQAGNDPGRIMRASAELNLQAARGHAQELYGRVRDLAQPLGDVPPTRTLAQTYAALDAIQQSTLNVDPTGATKAQLERILERLEPKTVTSAPDPFYRTTTTTTTPSSPYAVMDKLSNDLGTVISQTHMQDTYGAKILGAVKQAVDDDMRQFALQSGKPDLVLAQQAADAFYPQVVRQRERVRGMDNIPSDELTRYMFQPRRGERAEQWFNALDSKGQAAARAEILTQALYDGPAPAIQPATGTFSPARLAGNLERLRAVTGVTFPQGGEVRWQLNGFVNLLRHIERAGQYAENPPTGQRLMEWMQIPQAVFGAMTGSAAGPVGTLAGAVAPIATEAASGRLAKMLLMNPGGRNFLLAASDLRPGSPAMHRLVNDLAQRLPALAAQTLEQEKAQPAVNVPQARPYYGAASQ